LLFKIYGYLSSQNFNLLSYKLSLFLHGVKVKNYILVVDDDQLILYGLAKILTNDGYEVITAGTAAEAIEKLSYCPYDLCLLDVHLPDLSGLELMVIIRDMCPKTKIVIMTASFLDFDELSDNNTSAIANGASQFIPKPFNLCDISDVVQRALKGEENFQAGIRLSGKSTEKKSRKRPRTPWDESIVFQMSIIDQGDYTRKSLEARAVDISDNGIGLLTPYPLKELQVIGFDEKMENRIGVVVWSKMIDEDNCRVGIRFA